MTIIVIMVKGSDQDPRLGFSPVEVHLIIGVNNTVTWKNEDSDWHKAHSNIPEFDSRMVPPGGSFTHTFLRPGIYPYHCDPHPWMTGKVTVDPPLAGMIVPALSTFPGASTQIAFLVNASSAATLKTLVESNMNLPAIRIVT